MPSDFDSFDGSGFDAFIESPLAARTGTQGDRLLVWPARVFNGRPSVTIGRLVIDELGVQWDTHETWTGNVQDYKRIQCDATGYTTVPTLDEATAFWANLERPAWYTAILAGEWSGRILLGGYAAYNARPGTSTRPGLVEFSAAVRAFINPLAEFFGQSITADVAVDNTAPFNAGNPNEHPLTEGVDIVGRLNQDHGTAVIGGDGTSLTDILGQSVARETVHTFTNGRRVSALVTGDQFGVEGDSGIGAPRWSDSSRQLARNFWEVPV